MQHIIPNENSILGRLLEIYNSIGTYSSAELTDCRQNLALSSSGRSEKNSFGLRSSVTSLSLVSSKSSFRRTNAEPTVSESLEAAVTPTVQEMFFRCEAIVSLFQLMELATIQSTTDLKAC